MHPQIGNALSEARALKMSLKNTEGTKVKKKRRDKQVDKFALKMSANKIDRRNHSTHRAPRTNLTRQGETFLGLPASCRHRATDERLLHFILGAAKMGQQNLSRCRRWCNHHHGHLADRHRHYRRNQPHFKISCRDHL